MADAFDRFLASSLAPDDRLPDRHFVARVQAQILLEDRLASERRALIVNLVTQVGAVLAVAAALWVLGRAAPVAQWVAAFPTIALAGVMLLFVFVVSLLARPGMGRAMG